MKLCPRPTLIPVLNKHVTTGQAGNRDGIAVAPKAFILVHAVQLLPFAQRAWDRDQPYTRDASDYPHRFPTPAKVGGDIEKHVGDTFSMEDLHRAILLFYQLVIRCLSRGAWIGRPAPTKKSQFPGYVKPELARLADVPDVPISGTTRLRLAEAIQMEDAAISQREIRARAREYNREMREKEREEGRIPFPEKGWWLTVPRLCGSPTRSFSRCPRRRRVRNSNGQTRRGSQPRGIHVDRTRDPQPQARTRTGT